MKNLIILDHPLIKRDLAILRDKRTTGEEFRGVIYRISGLIAYEVFRELRTKTVAIRTPLEKTKGFKIEQQVILVPVLRAGLGFIEGFIQVIPEARIGHIGIFRDEKTLKPVDYYVKLPKNLSKAKVCLLDPMLATGGSASAAISYLKKKGARNICMASLVAAPEGVKAVQIAHPHVKIFTCALDRKLNKKGYILPGLGDAGDRIFGTE
ncbi:MAG: uracil phosphoribosyltransferase [Bacteroidetes bacterium]|nr:uracil phosphoribosyltransferase [Bacteroidota bacterium]